LPAKKKQKNGEEKEEKRRSFWRVFGESRQREKVSGLTWTGGNEKKNTE